MYLLLQIVNFPNICHRYDHFFYAKLPLQGLLWCFIQLEFSKNESVAYFWSLECEPGGLNLSL